MFHHSMRDPAANKGGEPATGTLSCYLCREPGEARLTITDGREAVQEIVCLDCEPRYPVTLNGDDSFIAVV